MAVFFPFFFNFFFFIINGIRCALGDDAISHFAIVLNGGRQPKIVFLLFIFLFLLACNVYAKHNANAG